MTRPTVRWVGLLLLLWASGCAASGAGSARARDFQRDEADEIPLRRLAVWVASKPAVEDEGSLSDVDAFGPPRVTQVLAPPRVDALMQRTLQIALDAWAEERGFELSTVSTPEARPTLGAVLDAADADAVLIIRVVPVDRFSIFEQAGEQKLIDTGDPTSQVVTTAEEATDRLGRLLLGQAFLFEPRSRVRIWSRQLPDFPESGRLVPEDPLLRYGFVAESVDEVLDPADKARRAADAFVPAILAGFPEPRDGDPAALAALASEDVQRKEQLQRFLDRNHVGVEVSFGWELPSIRSEARVSESIGALQPVETALPDLTTGELAPSGSIEVARPKVLWIAPGGTTFSAGFELGIIPGDYSRTAFVESADIANDDVDVAVPVAVNGGTAVGGALAVGRLVPLTPRLFLLPEIGFFVDVYAFDVSSTVPDDTHVTLGGQGELSVMYRLGPKTPLYVRGGGGGRIGGDVAGGFFASLVLSAGLGLLF